MQTHKRNQSRRAGIMIPFGNTNTSRKINNYSYSTLSYYDCLAQCFYALKYSDLRTSQLLQEIALIDGGISPISVIRMLNYAYDTYNTWRRVKVVFTLDHSKKKTASMIRSDHIKNIIRETSLHLRPNHATICYIESISDIPNHFVIIFMNNKGEIRIRDPQNGNHPLTWKLQNYLNTFRRSLHTVYILYDMYDTPHEENKVTEFILRDVFDSPVLEPVRSENTISFDRLLANPSHIKPSTMPIPKVSHIHSVWNRNRSTNDYHSTNDYRNDSMNNSLNDSMNDYRNNSF